MRSYSLIAAAALFAVPIVAGEVSGQFSTSNGAQIKPKYVVAFESRDPRDARKRAIEVVLSEVEIDMAQAIAELDPHQDVVNQMHGHNYIFLWVLGKYDVRMNATYSATMTQYLAFTGVRLKNYIPTLTADAVAGHVWMATPGKTADGDSYSMDVAFSTPITRLPGATKLAAGGGEPGKALQALLVAIERKDWNAIQAGVSDARRKSFDDLDDAISTLGIWLPKKIVKITRGELRGDSAVLEMEAEVSEGVKAVYLVRMVKRGSSWVFDEATRAGMID